MSGSTRGARGSTSARKARAVTLLLLIVAVGCGEGGPPRGGTAVIAAGSDLDLANPLVSVDAWTNEVLRYALFLPLIRYGEPPELDYQPALAESWELTGDTGVVFHLRDDVPWHDGSPTTAHDVLFTFERVTDPATGFPNAGYFGEWTGAEVVDSFTIRFAFDPQADPLAGLPFTPIVPKHLLDSIPPERMRQAGFNREPVGNGPFRFVSQRAGDRWIFEANPDFPEALGGRPLLDRVVWRVVPDNTAQLAELQTGEVDLALQPRPEQVTELAERDGIEAVTRPSRQFRFIAWNARREPLGDPRVRSALAMAIDRQRIVDGLRHGQGQVAVTPVMPFHWAYDEGLEPLPYDTDSARVLLAAAGISDRDEDGVLELADGSDFSITIKLPAGSAYNRDIAEAVRNDLAELGVAVSTQPTEVGTLFGDVTSTERRFDAALLGWSGDFRLDLRDLFHSAAREGPYQFASYANPEVDSLMERAAREPVRRRAAPSWARVQELLRDEQPWTVLYYQTEAYLARERLRNLDMDIRGALVNLPRWWVEDSGGGDGGPAADGAEAAAADLNSGR